MTDSKNEKALEAIARNYFELQKFELAITYCEELLKVNEDNIAAYSILAEIYLYLDDPEKSLKYVEKGLNICTTESAEFWVQKAWIDYMVDFEQFIRTMNMHLDLNQTTSKTTPS